MTNKLIPKGGNDCVETPLEVAKMIVKHYNPTGKILEPCKGEGNFLKVLPENTVWCEIKESIDFLTVDLHRFDWIITNPPFSKFRAFLNKSMETADNVVFLTSINHFWLKARLRDMREKGFGIKEIMFMDTPKSFPQSGFQIGCIYIQRDYSGDIKVIDERT